MRAPPPLRVYLESKGTGAAVVAHGVIEARAVVFARAGQAGLTFSLDADIDGTCLMQTHRTERTPRRPSVCIRGSSDRNGKADHARTLTRKQTHGRTRTHARTLACTERGCRNNTHNTGPNTGAGVRGSKGQRSLGG